MHYLFVHYLQMILWLMISSPSVGEAFGEVDINQRIVDALMSEAPDTAVISRWIRDSSDLNMAAASGRLPLVTAASSGAEEVVVLMLQRGANADALTQNGGSASALMGATVSDSLAIARLLIDAGANVDLQDANGDPALHWAVYQGRESMTRLLVDQGARTDIVSRHGAPLHIALRKGHEQLLPILEPCLARPPSSRLIQAVDAANATAVRERLALDRQAAQDRDCIGRTALHWAASRCSECVAPLLEAGASSQATGPAGFTPLMVAARDGNSAVVRQLVTHGARINAHATDKGLRMTALALASAQGHFDTVAVLLQEGADPARLDTIGNSALFWAVGGNYRDIARALIVAGADPERANADGLTPGALAEQLGWSL